MDDTSICWFLTRCQTQIQENDSDSLSLTAWLHCNKLSAAALVGNSPEELELVSVSPVKSSVKASGSFSVQRFLGTIEGWHQVSSRETSANPRLPTTLHQDSMNDGWQPKGQSWAVSLSNQTVNLAPRFGHAGTRRLTAQQPKWISFYYYCDQEIQQYQDSDSQNPGRFSISILSQDINTSPAHCKDAKKLNSLSRIFGTKCWQNYL